MTDHNKASTFKIAIIYIFSRYICLGQGVTDQQIIEAIDNGYTNYPAIQNLLGSGTGCGGCRDLAADLIDQDTQTTLKKAIGLSNAV